MIKNRKTNRLKGYDYSKDGYYFVTVCTKNKENFFEHIKNNAMVLNDSGKMIEKWYQELKNKFLEIQCDECIVMPNHFHCIIQICRDKPACLSHHVNGINLSHDNNEDRYEKDRHAGLSLPCIVQWFKTMTTNEYIHGVKTKNWQPFNRKLWQRSFYDHIIRDEKALLNIRQYIIKNPLKWDLDIENINKKK